MFIALWSLTMEKHADRWHLMTITQQVEAYGDVAIKSRSQAFRDFARYRKVFAMDPTELVVRAELHVKNRRQAQNVWKIGSAVV
jgi:hypothetical protein